MRISPLIFSFLFISQILSAQTDFRERLSEATVELINEDVIYDPGYYQIDYPNGDIPADKGVCTDVIIRAYRLVGIDLQKEVHEDMVRDFENYPNIWGLSRADKNIDHRRVPNLMTYFSKFGLTKPNSKDSEDYTSGDIVCWDLGNGMTHIGIVVDRKSNDGLRSLVVHNIGNGQVLADCLFEYTIIGHYFYE